MNRLEGALRPTEHRLESVRWENRNGKVGWKARCSCLWHYTGTALATEDDALAVAAMLHGVSVDGAQVGWSM